MPDIESIEQFIQTDSPDGGFLQSVEWRKFQESTGRKTCKVFSDNFSASIIEHSLPVTGKYFYIPRGPVVNYSKGNKGMAELINLAKKGNIGWIRFDANSEEMLKIISKTELFSNKNSALKIRKAPHDMQPREIFMIDIVKPEEQLLTEMKSKTRYNIKLAQKHNVKIKVDQKYLDDFLKLVKITAKRDGITPHPDEYYRKMFETIPADNLKLYVAEFKEKIISANVVVFYGKVATYLHGAADNDYRNVMAPYLLQWQAIIDAKAVGCERYDMGGIRTYNVQHKTYSKSSWSGITRFKTGFSVVTNTIEFPGSYDIVLNSFKYNLYRILQRIKALF
jgi:peptidoglycan pentaglycine glycine transferase (the first glycine)